jgi:aspartyl protease family protein
MATQELPGWLKHVALWGVLGTAVFLGVQWWMAERQRPQVLVAGSSITLQRAADGHFHWPGTVNGQPVDFLVDTGATGTTLPAALAEQLGLRAEGRMQSNTAGGVVQGYVARADVRLQGGVVADGLQVGVLPALHTPLLGMDVLHRLKLTQQDGKLRLEAPR